MGLVFKSRIKSESQFSVKLLTTMQVFIVALLVVAASAHTTLLKHKLNNAPVLNLNHKNVHLTQQVPVLDTVDVVAPQVYTTLNKQVVPQVNTIVNKQVVPQMYTTINKEVVPQMYTTLNKQVVPQVYTTTLNNQVVPQTYTTLNSQVIPQTYTTLNNQVIPQVQVVPQVYSQVQPIVTPIIQTPVFKTIQTQAELTEGYVAANHGAVHTAPMPEGPSNDGFFASHHINLPNVKA